MPDDLLIARSDRDLALLPRMANRHGLVAGATGTGKTVTLQRMAEAFSRSGVPVFLADVKGDLAGLSQPGAASPRITQRLTELGVQDFAWQANPVCFWDVYGAQGHPVRTTISEFGPLLLGELLDLNETQRGVLALVFKVADDDGLLLLDLKDLRAMLGWVGENAKQLTTRYGNVSAASVGAIQRGLLALEEQGGEHFFAEPALDIRDLMRTDSAGRGVINVLAADRLMQAPKLYACLLLWLLSELFEELPEVGDPEKPRLVFFFDEAHLLFDGVPKVLLEKIEQVVRLIRSKGVGVYFVTQNPLDVPDSVLGQLGNRVQHALRAFTPRDQKAVKAAATTMRGNPGLEVERVITELGVGEALVSLLDEQGRPAIVERAKVLPPHSRLGPISGDERAALLRESAMAGRYDQTQDRESAYECLRDRSLRVEVERAERGPRSRSTSRDDDRGRAANGSANRSTSTRRSSREGVFEAAAKSAARAMGTQLGREILRGVLGSIFGSRR